jgi:NADH:ubiquinone oxidoreductase subunit 3 (subunit A)
MNVVNENLRKTQKEICYNCGEKVIESTRKKCPNCHIQLRPNDMDWRNSFLLLLLLLIITPITIMMFYLLFN